MKRLIAATILLIIIVSSYFLGDYYIKDNCKKVNSLLSDCVSEYSKEGTASKSAKKLNDFWSEKENLLSVFANHRNIDEIELAINSLLIYSSTTEKEIFYEYSGRVKTLVHQLLEDTTASPHTVF